MIGVEVKVISDGYLDFMCRFVRDVLMYIPIGLLFFFYRYHIENLQLLKKNSMDSAGRKTYFFFATFK